MSNYNLNDEQKNKISAMLNNKTVISDSDIDELCEEFQMSYHDMSSYLFDITHPDIICVNCRNKPYFPNMYPCASCSNNPHFANHFSPISTEVECNGSLS